jgi:NTE family protein
MERTTIRLALAAAAGAAAVLALGCGHALPACPVVPATAAAPIPPPPPLCPAPRSYPFRNVVLEGGGVKGIAYAGAFDVLAQQGILDEIEGVAGTSAGAIQAALLALRYTPAEIRSVLFGIDFKQFEDGEATGLLRLFRRFGWFRGDALLELMQCLVGEKTGGKPHATFGDLAGLGMRDLRVFATDLNTGTAKEFSAAKTPDAEVALAVRTSASFPLFFAAVRLGGDTLVDGGVLRNYPVDAFDGEDGLDYATLGFVLENTKAPPRRRPVDDLPQYAEALLETLLEVQVDALATDPPNLERTVILDDLGISTLDFELSDQQKRDLVQSGAECTCSYLAAWQRWHDTGQRPGGRDLAPGEVLPLAQRGKCGSAFD